MHGCKKYGGQIEPVAAEMVGPHDAQQSPTFQEQLASMSVDGLWSSLGDKYLSDREFKGCDCEACKNRR